jgi:L-asparaginase
MSAAKAMKCGFLYQPLRALASCAVSLAVALGAAAPSAAAELPRVHLITLTAGSDGHLIRAATAAGAKGIVVEVFGRGNVPPAIVEAVKEARAKDVAVVYTTRTRGGRVEVDQESRQVGVIGGEDLDGLKARMLLVAALGAGTTNEKTEEWIERLAGR